MKSRLAASVALAAALMLGTTGCTFTANVATQKVYNPSDGVGTEVGPLAVRNALLIGADSETLSLVMTVTNADDVDRRVTVQWVSAGERVSESIIVPAGGRTRVGGADDVTIILTDTEAALGGLFALYFTAGAAQGSELLVPVLDGSLTEYELYIP